MGSRRPARPSLLVLVLLVASALTVVAPAAARSSTSTGPVDSIPPARATTPIYLSLGDSVPMWNGNRSFPNILTGYYQKDVPHLQLVNMACSGETTQSMMTHSFCAPGGSQLANAVSFLRQHRGSVDLVTMDIGGNDVVGCVGIADPTTCFTQNLAGMKARLTYILDALRIAAGPRVPIVGMNVFDPLLGDWLGPKSVRAQATLGLTAVAQLDAAMDHDYAAAKSAVADVEKAFDSGDMTHFVRTKWGRVPVAVAKACTLLDIECNKGQAEGFGDDPDNAGARVIAQAFERAIGTLRPPR